MKPHLPHHPAQPASCTRRKAPRGRRVAGALLALALAGAQPLPSLGSTTEAVRQSPVVARSGPSPAEAARAAAILRIVRQQMASEHLRAVIVRVTIDGREIVTAAMGESITGMPATTDMHFRNGAVAISYMAMLLLQLVDEKKVTLDDKLSTWLPSIPNASRVTLAQLARMTSGYHDYVIGNTAFIQQQLSDPFRQITTQEQLSYANLDSLWYEPGTNWNYAHTNYVLLGLALEKITGQSIPALMQERIFGPLQMRNTRDPGGTPEIAQPVLHSFTSERRETLGIAPSTRFYEESTYWNPSWTLAQGAIQYTNIHDMATSAEAIGSGRLLSPESHQLQIAPTLRGFGAPLEGCATCGTLTDFYTYGIGIVISGSWVLQNPLFSGQAGVMAYLPSKKIAIAVAVTFDEEAFDRTGNYSNGADTLFREIGAYLAPDDPPPVKRQPL